MDALGVRDFHQVHAGNAAPGDHPADGLVALKTRHQPAVRSAVVPACYVLVDSPRLLMLVVMIERIKVPARVGSVLAGIINGPVTPV